MTDTISYSELYQKAIDLGWDDVAICEPTIPHDDIAAYEKWLDNGYHADLSYMENRVRVDPQAFFPGAKTAIMFASYYRQPRIPFQKDRGVVASYARGRDYHNVHKKRSRKLIQWLEQRTNKHGIARAFSDSAPVLERALAAKSGMGWFGKSCLLIHRRFGTFFLLSGILTQLQVSSPPQRHTYPLRLPRCGACRRCLDACPTGALVRPYTLDARRCLSYHLIESKSAIPSAIAKVNPGYILGCDICQDVCPHNVRKPLSLHSEFSPEAGVGTHLDKEELSRLTETPNLLHGTPLQRRKVEGLYHTAETLALLDPPESVGQRG